MTHKSRILWMAGAIAIASSVSIAHAAKSTDQQKQAKGEKLAQIQRTFVQPKTAAQGEKTLVTKSDGSASALVPTELWSSLSATTDENGKVRMHESEGSETVVTSEVQSHE